MRRKGSISLFARLSVWIFGTGCARVAVAPSGVAAPLTRDSRQGIELFHQQKLTQATEFFSAALKKNPADAQAAFYTGRIALARGEFPKAIEWLEKTVALEESNSEYFEWLGRAYAKQAQRETRIRQPALARQTKSALEKSVALDPNNLQARHDLIRYYLSTPAVVGGGEGKARDQAEEIAKRDAGQGHLASGRIAESRKDFKKAEEEYQLGVATHPDDIEGHRLIGCVCIVTGKSDQAFSEFEKVLKLDPLDVDAKFQIGRTGALSVKNLDRAEKCLNDYLASECCRSFEPEEQMHSELWARFYLGKIAVARGQTDAAKAQYQAALVIDPSRKEIRSALGNLR